jgi:hypothetical protein
MRKHIQSDTNVITNIKKSEVALKNHLSLDKHLVTKATVTVDQLTYKSMDYICWTRTMSTSKKLCFINLDLVFKLLELITFQVIKAYDFSSY